MRPRRRTSALRAVALGAALWLGGCGDRSRPWEAADAAPPGPAPPEAAPDAGRHDPLDVEDAAAGAAGAEAEPHPPVRVGGPWVRCYGNFRPSGDPRKDLTRLSLLCGPENGMRRLSKAPLEGTVTEGGPAVTAPLPVRRGECYRVFAASEPGVVDLDVTVRSSRGAAVASDHGEDGWPVVQPDRPLCPFEDDAFTLEVTAKRGSGRFAAEVWHLRTPHRTD